MRYTAPSVPRDRHRRRSQLPRAADPPRRQLPGAVGRATGPTASSLQHLQRQPPGRGSKGSTGGRGLPMGWRQHQHGHLRESLVHWAPRSTPWFASVGTDPGVLTSTNDGQAWSYYGRLMDTVQHRVRRRLLQVLG
jgi:hypothetical protein